MKKFILIMVEGISEEQSLYPAVEKLIEFDENLAFDIQRGDVFSDSKIGDIKPAIGKIINKYLRINKLKKSDILCIAHVIDIDCSFAADHQFIVDKDSDYEITDSCIKCASDSRIEEIKKRNQFKKQKVNIMASTYLSTGIPYHLFYNSIDLEHFFHNEFNCSDERKALLAFKLGNHFCDANTSLTDEVQCRNCVTVTDFKTSWIIIQDSKMTFSRQSNLHLLEDYIKKTRQ